MNKQSIGNAEHYKWGDNCDAWFLLQSEKLTVISEKMPPGTSEQLHCHQHARQVFYILSGIANFEMNGSIETLNANESIEVPANVLHKMSNQYHEDLSFLLVSTPDAHGDRIEILDFSEELKEHISILNKEWLEKYFRVEPVDVIQLSNPVEEIINKGGSIFYARFNGEIVGTASLLKVDENVFELGKMAVTDKVQGQGIGKVLMDHVMNIAKNNNISKLVLYSNTKLKSAIHLYKKYGFTEVPLEFGHYERANIKMEKVL